MAKTEKRIMMPFDKVNKGTETEASKAGKTKKGDTKSNPPKGKATKDTGKNVKQPVNGKKPNNEEMPMAKGKSVQMEKKKPTFAKGGKTVKKK